MKAMINVGPEITKESIEGLTNAIVSIIKAGTECHLEQKTIRHAITRLCMSVKVENVVVSNNSLTNETPVATGINVDSADDLTITGNIIR